MSNPPIKFILASESPRRSKILADAGFNFEVLTVKVSEIFDKNLNVDDQIMKVAETKGQAVAHSIKPLKNQDYLILSADTVVILDKLILGKPKDRSEAEKFLGLLSGRAHCVKTAICFINLPEFQVIRDIDTTIVEFKTLSPKEIKSYLDGNEWQDKAGAYAIQGTAREFVKKIVGSNSNVVGLPIELVQDVMKKHGWFERCRKN